MVHRHKGPPLGIKGVRNKIKVNSTPKCTNNLARNAAFQGIYLTYAYGFV